MVTGNIEQGLSQKTKDKLHYGTAGFLIVQAVVLAFISFFITLTIGTGVIAWGGLCMGTALTLIGGGMYFHSQMVTFETKANMKMEEMSEHIDRELDRRRRHKTRGSDTDLNTEDNGTEAEEDC
jgi:hypothetical protein